MISLEGVEHLPPALVPHDHVLLVIRHLPSLVGNAHVADDKVGERVGVVEAGVARGGDDVGELCRGERFLRVFFFWAK